jgi:hypothetical protein
LEGGGEKEQSGWVENRGGIRKKTRIREIRSYMKGNGRNERKRMSE